MFYLPFELRNQTEYCTPKGPNFKRAPLVKFSISGTDIHLRVPRHRTTLPTEPRHSHAFYNLEELHLEGVFQDKPQWRSLPIVFRIWDYYGPWFTGRLSATSFSLTVITPDNHKAGTSFFHPKVFESGVADYLTYLYGEKKNATGNKQQWLAPVNWKPFLGLPCVAASFDVLENNEEAYRTGSIKNHLCFPITDQHLICLEFNFSRNQFLPNESEAYKDPDDWINISSMQALAKDIINSVEVKLSSEAKDRQAQALTGLGDTSLTKEFSPLKWM